MPDNELRAEFETWAHNKLQLQERRGVYENFSTQAAWEAYCAAHASGHREGLKTAMRLIRARAKEFEECGVDPVTTSETWDCGMAIQWELEK